MPTAIEKLLNNWKVISVVVGLFSGGLGTGVQSYRANVNGEARVGNALARFECVDQLTKEELEHTTCRTNARADTAALRDDLFHCLESGGTLQP